MKQNRLVFFIFTLGLAACVPLAAQTGTSAGPLVNASKTPAAANGSAQPTGGVACTADDRLGSMRCVADQLLAAYNKLDDDNQAQIDALMKKKGCNILRVDGLQERAKDAMNVWYEAEKKYWDESETKETERVEGQQKVLTSMIEDQATTQQLLDSEQQSHDKLLRDKADLEKSATRTKDIRDAIDQDVLDIQGSVTRIEQVQKRLDDVTLSINNTRTLLDVRLVEIRRYHVKLDAWKVERESYYQAQRAAADAACSVPGTKSTTRALPTPKGAQ